MSWVSRGESWQRTQVEYCEVTGQLLAPRYWEFEDEGRKVRARDPHCEEIYWRFVRPARLRREAAGRQQPR